MSEGRSSRRQPGRPALSTLTNQHPAPMAGGTLATRCTAKRSAAQPASASRGTTSAMAGTLPSTSFAPGAAVALMATTLGGLLRQLSTRIYPACRTGPSGGGRAHMALFRTRYFNHMSRRFALLVLLISVSYQHQWPSHHPVVELSALNMAMLYRRQILPLQLVQEECRSTSTRDTSSHCDGTVAANNKATDDVPSGQSDSGADEHAYDQQLLDMDHEELTLAKQRVALFTASYNHHVDGVALTLNRLVDHLLEQGHKVLVFAPTNGKAPALNASGEIVVAPSIPAPLWHEYQITTGFNEDVLGRLRAFQPTLIHIAIQDVLGWRALLYARRNQLPTVCSYHTRWTNYLGYYTMLPKGLVDFGWWYLRQFHTRCDVTMPPTPVIAQELAAHGISDGVRLWPRGIDVRGFNPKFRSAEWRREIGVLESEVLILTVCRLRWEKVSGPATAN
mmetsp:Transcript_10408/g.38372  ORF Transcript_10408/g.38372 Transcript_10408/m.38372 type:complete len:449 (-) Transcript_10408:785-2131(-)